MDDKLGCWEIRMASKEMDMSGGDNVDGPRWTGGYVDSEVTLVVVAPTQALAEAAALSRFYSMDKAAVKKAKKLRDVDAVVHLTTNS